MKKLFTLCFLMAFAVVKGWGQSAGFNTSYTVFSINGGANAYYCMPNNGQSCGGNPSLDGASLGTFTLGTNTLVLKGAQHNVYKCGSADITATNLNYRVYKTGTTPGTFTSTGIGYTSGNANGCGGADQQWQDVAKTINVLSGLTPGNYTIELYSDEATTLGPQYLSNNNPNYTNYKATFTVAAASGTPVLLYSGTNVAGGTYYATLKAAFDAINAGTYTGALHILLYGSTTETASDVLNASGSGSASYTALDIKPDAGAAVTVSGALTNDLITFNGADNVTIDGLNTGGNALTISNTTAGTTASTIRLANDATGNTIKNATILGANTNTTLYGTIIIGAAATTGTTITGNDNNIISGNNIGPVSASVTPAVAIWSNSESNTNDNSGIQILNNNIYDYFSAASTAYGIRINAGFTTGANTWTITGNKFYQTTARTITTGTTHMAISIPAGGGYTISNNTIGYAAAVGTGTTSYSAAVAFRFIGIDLEPVTTATNSVQGNTIGGIAMTTSSGAPSDNGIFSGIYLVVTTAATNNIGTTTGNVIGATSGTGSITVTSSTSAALIAGIAVQKSLSGATVNIQNNTVASFATGSTSGAAIGYAFRGIALSTASTSAVGTYNVYSNTIGNTTANNIAMGISGTTTTGVSTVYGIWNNSTGTITIGASGTGNTIQNIGGYSTASSATVAGIYNAAAAGLSVTYNTISGLFSGSSATVAAAPVYGFYNISIITGTLVISNNTFQSWTNLYTTGVVAPIWQSSSTASGNTQNNVISNISRASAITSGTFYGYYNGSSPTGTQVFSGNTIGSITNTPTTGSGTFYGLYNLSSSSSTWNVYSNTITNITSGSGTSYGIYDGYGAANSTCYSNNINNIATSGTLYGIYLGSSLTSTVSCYSNVINTLSSSGSSSTLYGINTFAITPSIYKNKIYDLTESGTTGVTYGIYTGGGTTLTITNNLIGDLKAPASSPTSAPYLAVAGLYISSGTTVNAYYNTIYLSASSTGANFSTAAVYATATSTTVLLRNNIFANASVKNGNGLAVAYMRSSNTVPPTNYSTSSNNNDFYGTTAVYYGYNAATPVTYFTITDYKNAIGARDQASVSENPTFVSTIGSAATYLHISTTAPTLLESGGATVTGVTDDFDGDTRAATPDIGADEFTGTQANPCVAPTAQPTVLTFPTILYNGLTGSFTVASPAPSGYVVFRSTVNVAPMPVDATSYPASTSTPYTIGGNTYYSVANSGGTFTESATLTANTTYYYFIYSYNNTNCTGGPKYLATSPLTGSVLTCTAAAATLTGTVINTTSATITYAGVAGAVSTQLEYAVAGSSNWVIASPSPTTITTGTNTYTLTGLTAGTAYDIRIIEPNAVCGTYKTTPSAFTTPVVTSIPWTEPFATASTVPSGWSTTGWNIGSTTAITAQGGTGDYYIYKNLYSSFPTGTFSTINVGVVGSTDKLSFDYILANFSSPYAVPASGSGNYVVSISTDYGATYNTLETVTNDGVAGWRTKTYSLSSYAGQYVKIRIVGNWITGTPSPDYYLAFDNFKIFTPSTLDVGPTALVAPATTGCYGTSEPVTVTIKNYGTAALDLSVNPVTVNVSVSGAVTQSLSATANTGIVPVNGTVNVTMSTTLNMSAAGIYTFNASTTLTGDNNSSNDALTTATRTVVAPVATPYTQDFSGGTFPSNWTNTSSWIISTAHGRTDYGIYKNLYSSVPSAQFNMLKLGPIQSTDLLSYDYRVVDYTSYPSTATTGNWGTIQVQASTDCGVTFTTIQTIDQNSHVSSLSWATKNVSLSAYAGQNVIIRFLATWVSGDYYIDFDNFNVAAAPNCIAPSLGTITSITSNSASVPFTCTSCSPGNAYIVEYGPAGFTPGTGATAGTNGTVVTGTASPIAIGGLTANTSYDVYVRQNCTSSSNGYSANSSKATFTTQCVYVTAYPFTETYETSSSTRNCWTNEYTSGSRPWVYTTGSVYGTVTSAHGGTVDASLNDRTYYSAVTKLVSPVLDLSSLSSSGARVSFWYQNPETLVDDGFGDYYYYHDYLKVYYRTSSSGTWTLIPNATYTGSVSAWTQVTLTLPSISSTYQIAFEGSSDPFKDYQSGDLVIDDVVVDAVPNCTGATPGTAAASATSICGASGSTTLSATGYSTGATTIYNWQSSSDKQTFTDISGQTNPASATITGISTTTYYRLRVTCTATSTTNYSSSIMITVSNPSVTSTTPGSNCGTGTVALNAVPSSGATISWYAASSGGTALATGNTFTTPSISTTTTYYASAGTGSTVTVGPSSPTTQGGTIGTQLTDWDVYFTLKANATLKSINIFPLASGQSGVLKIYSGTGESGTLLATINYTTSVSGGATAQTIPINYTFATTGSYTIWPSTMPSSGFSRNTTGGSYPYTSSAADITGNEQSSTSYQGLYNWQFTSGCESGRTPVIATIITPPTAYTLSTNQTSSCATNPTAYLSLSGSESDVSYQVYNGTTAIGTPVQGNGSALTDFYGVTASGTYKVIGTRTVNGTNCTNTMSGTPTITVATINIYNVTGTGTTCGTGTITLSGSQSGITYRLTGPAATQTKTGTGSALTFTVTVSGTYAINASTSGGCYEDMNGTPTVTINPLPTQYIVTGGGISCSGSAVVIGLSNSQTGVNYQLYRGGTTPVGSAVAGTGSAISFAAQSTAGTYTVVATNASTGCQQTMSGSAVLTAGTSPTASFDQPTYTSCSPTAVGVVFKGTANATISYTISTNGGNPVTQTPVTIDANGNNQVVNSSTSAGTYTYTITNVTVSGNSCPGVITTSTTTVTINQPPTVADISGPDYIAVSKTGSYSSTTTGGTWTISNTAYATFASGYTSLSNPVVIQGVSVGTITLSYTVTNATGCSNVVTKTVQVFDNTIARYRSYQDGRASDASTWEFLNDNNVWVYPSPTVPDNSANIEIRHNVRMEVVDYDGTAQATVSITNHTTGGNTIDGTLTIFPGRFFQSQGSVNFGGKPVILKSDATGTGAIGIMATTIANATNVQVERFTDGKPSANAMGTSRRAWRLITSPVTGQTIHQAWQENAGSNANPNAYGTLITGYNMPDAATAAQQGYDFTGAGYNSSIRHYTAASNAWVSLPSPGTLTSLQTEQAYMLYVRGDRSINATGTTPATLRSTGTLQQGARSLSFTAGTPYVLAGNPYASAIDFGQFYSNATSNNSALIKDQFYSWNSTIGTYGAYVLVTHTGTGANAGGYLATPDVMTGISAQNKDDYRYIPNGSGFFVTPLTATTSGTLHFIETDKAPGKVPPINPFRVVPDASNVRQLVVNLNLKDSDTSATLADGFRALFSNDYEGNEKDNSNAKAFNFNENLGLVREQDSLIIEARADVKKTDTLYMKLWNVTKRAYQFQVKADNFASAPGIQAWLEDSYLATKQELALNGSITTVNFDVTTDAASASSDRFRIVFENNTTVLPVTITKVSAQPKSGGAEVNWTVANETNIKGYTVEKSNDGGRTFSGVGTQQAAHNNPQAALTVYSGYDAAPQTGDNYYRIRIEAKDGTISYSDIVKVTIGANGTGIQITLYPNPVREGKANLQMTNLSAGTYLVSVYTGSGQTVYQKKITITQPNTTQSEQLLLGNNIAQGSYQIRLADHKGNILFTDKLVVGR